MANGQKRCIWKTNTDDAVIAQHPGTILLHGWLEKLSLVLFC